MKLKISHEVEKYLMKLTNVSQSWKISHEVEKYLTKLHSMGKSSVDEDAAPLHPGALWILRFKIWAQIGCCHLQQRIIGKLYSGKFKKFENALLRMI